MTKNIRFGWSTANIDIFKSDRRAHRKPTNWKKSLRDHKS